MTIEHILQAVNLLTNIFKPQVVFTPEPEFRPSRPPSFGPPPGHFPPPFHPNTRPPFDQPPPFHPNFGPPSRSNGGRQPGRHQRTDRNRGRGGARSRNKNGQQNGRSLSSGLSNSRSRTNPAGSRSETDTRANGPKGSTKIPARNFNDLQKSNNRATTTTTRQAVNPAKPTKINAFPELINLPPRPVPTASDNSAFLDDFTRNPAFDNGPPPSRSDAFNPDGELSGAPAGADFDAPIPRALSAPALLDAPSQPAVIVPPSLVETRQKRDLTIQTTTHRSKERIVIPKEPLALAKPMVSDFMRSEKDVKPTSKPKKPTVPAKKQKTAKRQKRSYGLSLLTDTYNAVTEFFRPSTAVRKVPQSQSYSVYPPSAGSSPYISFGFQPPNPYMNPPIPLAPAYSLPSRYPPVPQSYRPAPGWVMVNDRPIAMPSFPVQFPTQRNYGTAQRHDRRYPVQFQSAAVPVSLAPASTSSISVRQQQTHSSPPSASATHDQPSSSLTRPLQAASNAGPLEDQDIPSLRTPKESASTRDELGVPGAEFNKPTTPLSQPEVSDEEGLSQPSSGTEPSPVLDITSEEGHSFIPEEFLPSRNTNSDLPEAENEPKSVDEVLKESTIDLPLQKPEQPTSSLPFFHSLPSNVFDSPTEAERQDDSPTTKVSHGFADDMVHEDLTELENPPGPGDLVSEDLVGEEIPVAEALVGEEDLGKKVETTTLSLFHLIGRFPPEDLTLSNEGDSGSSLSETDADKDNTEDDAISEVGLERKDPNPTLLQNDYSSAPPLGPIDSPNFRFCRNRKFHETIDGRGFMFSWEDLHMKDTRIPWLDAANFCRRQCMELVSLENKEKNEMVFRKMTEGFIEKAWTSGHLCNFRGCNRTDVADRWFWMANGAPLSRRWHQDEPDNHMGRIGGTTESCVAAELRNSEEGLNDVDCDKSLPFICEDSPALLSSVGLVF